MSDNNYDQVGEEGELSEQEKQGVFQDLLSGSGYGLLSHFVTLIFFLLRNGPLQPYIAKA
jgi:hypothetical protein